MAKSKIEWCDVVWNPTVGCKKVSAGCARCYAERMAKRLAAMGQIEYQKVVTEIDANGRWTGHVLCLPERLDIPLKWKKPRRVFVNSMSDLFHEDVPDGFIFSAFSTMAKADHHQYIILTKRPERMCKLLNKSWTLSNVQLGVSVEDQRTADERIPWLLRTPAAVRIVSCEPMLSTVDLRHVHGDYVTFDVLGKSRFDYGNDGLGVAAPMPHGIDHVIVGCESGPNRRPMDIAWARSLRDQCQDAGVPFFLKQLEINGNLVKLPFLDGRQWEEYPTCASG